jgi:CRP-like cAMP-binding protein
LLQAFPAEALTRLTPRLEQLDLRHRLVLIEPGSTTEYVYFPDSGLVSLLMIMDDGQMAEVGAVGIEGMVGIPAALGMRGSPFQAMVQVPGSGRRLLLHVLQREVEQVPALKDMMLRYMHHRLTQVAQTAACNRLHSLSERCSRWLLTAHDSTQTPSFRLTQEFLALMMGVHRPSLTLTIAELRRQGLIDFRRGIITIKDRRALEQGSCGCYETLKRDAELVYRLS